MLKTVLGILYQVAIFVLCFLIVIWVLSLLGIYLPHNILVAIGVCLGLYAAIKFLSGSPPDKLV